MQYRIFGKTGEKVSVLGFGMMRLPIVGNDYGKVDYEKASKMVSYAVDHGVNYLDTSWPYHSKGMSGGGESEPVTGKIIKEVGRDKILLATKLPIWAVNAQADMERFLDKQLQRLQTDYVDFYLVHNINKNNWLNITRFDLRAFLDKIQRDGKVRHVGFSFHGTPRLFEEVLNFYDFSFCQHILNYYDIHFEAGIDCIRKAHNKGLGFVAMEPVMGGILANLPPEAIEIFNNSGIQRSPAAWALRWVWDQPEVSLLISGMHTMEQVEENIKVAEEANTPLTWRELEAIDRVRTLLRKKGAIPCVECDKCHCPPLDIDIRSNFGVYNRNESLKPIWISMVNYNMSLRGSGGEADLCTDCGQCAGMCPQGIDIPSELRMVSRRFKDYNIAEKL